MDQQKALNRKKARRVVRTRAKISGSHDRPRLAVFRSNRAVYAQLIDDVKGHTLASASSRELEGKQKKENGKAQAHAVGELIAKRALALGVKKAVFDRRSYLYHGRVESLAEGARKGGLTI